MEWGPLRWNSLFQRQVRENGVFKDLLTATIHISWQ